MTKYVPATGPVGHSFTIPYQTKPAVNQPVTERLYALHNTANGRQMMEGCVSDFHLLLEEQLPKLVRYAAALTREPDEAEALVEDTVREALANQRQCPRNGQIRTWLLTILHDLRDNPFRQASAGAGLPVSGPQAELTLSDLDRAMGRLLEEQRAIILLIGLEGMTYEQTAAILRIPVGTMRSRLARGREGLRRALDLSATAPRITRAQGLPTAADG